MGDTTITDRAQVSATGDAQPLSGSTLGVAGKAHEHRFVRAEGRVWLEARVDEAATMRLHAYCMDCGAVRHRLPRRGRPRGYFDRALANLKADLEGHPKYPKLAQVQSRLIAKALNAVPEFDDLYSIDFDSQWTLFLLAVQRIRPDIPIEIVEGALPRPSSRPRIAYIDLIASSSGGTPSDPRRAFGRILSRLRP